MEANEDDVIEVSPDKRYIRYNEILGRGAFKTVYKGFDEVDGIEVAWNQVSIDDALQCPQHLEKVYSEVHLLKTLKHENIIKSYMSWVDYEKKTINLITELFTSGSLRQYRRKHKTVDVKAIKNWARQILRGLHYLHSHNPPIIHRDLKCDNIFINGNHGEVKIGDLGLATIMLQPTARSVIGTPEFMAPELYDEEYNELVDIYSFGMCMLELVTCEYPYSECKNAAQIFKKVTTGIKPAALGKVKDQAVKQLIEKCLVPASQRLNAAELLNDPFLSSGSSKEILCVSLHASDLMPQSTNLPNSDHSSMEVDPKHKTMSVGFCGESMTSMPHISSLKIQRHNDKNVFRLQGDNFDNGSVSLTLRISDLCGRVRNIHFIFYLYADTAISIAGEMVEQLGLPNDDVAIIAEMIDDLILKLVPCWKPAMGTLGSSKCLYADSLVLPSDIVSTSSTENNGFSSFLAQEVVEQHALFSSSEVNHVAEESVNLSFRNFDPVISDAGRTSETATDSIDECSIEILKSVPERFGANACECLKNESNRNSSISFSDSYFTASNDMSSSISSLSLLEKSNEKYCDYDLKLELDAIEMQYQQCCRDLLRMRKEAVESVKRRWITKKKSSSIACR